MKIITNLFLSFLFLISSINSSAQSKNEQILNMKKYKNLKVKAVSLVEYEYTLEGNREPKGTLKQQIDYDQEGRKIESRVYSGNEVYHKTNFVYDDNNIEIRYYWGYEDGTKFKVIHYYDNKGFLTHSEQYDNRSFVNLTKEYNYDSKGKLAKEITKLHGEEFYYEYRYDIDGNLITKISSPWGGRNKERTDYTYYENGLVKEANTFDILDDPVNTIEYTYQFYKN